MPRTASRIEPISRFAALRVPNFRVYFVGQFLSVLGNWMQTVALAALVLDVLHHGGTVLGVTFAALYVPVIVFGPVGGLIADRMDKRRLVLTTQFAFTAVVGLLGVLVLTGNVALWSVLVLAALQGTVNSFDNPARQTFVHELVGDALVTNAVGLNMLSMNTARIIGPGVAGALLLVTDVGTLFLLNAASFCAFGVLLLCMRKANFTGSKRLVAQPGQVRAGLRYVRHNPLIGTALAMLVVVGGLAYNFPVLLPLFAKETFGLAKEDYGTFFSAMGVGAIVFGFVRGTKIEPTTAALVRATIGLGLSLAVLGLAPNVVAAYLLLPFLGAGSLNFLVIMNSTLQLNCDPEMRGRVMALYTMALLGTTPVGSFLVGAIAEFFGPRIALGVSGLGTVGAALWAAPHFRRISAAEDPASPEAPTDASVSDTPCGETPAPPRPPGRESPALRGGRVRAGWPALRTRRTR